MAETDDVEPFGVFDQGLVREASWSNWVRREFDEIVQTSLRGGASVVVDGPPGSGKSTLLKQLAAVAPSFNLRPLLLEPPYFTGAQVVEALRRREERTLLLIDDVDQLPDEAIRNINTHIKFNEPRERRIVLTARRADYTRETVSPDSALYADLDYVRLSLGPLTHSEEVALVKALRSILVTHEDTAELDVRQVVRAARGNLRTVAEAAAALLAGLSSRELVEGAKTFQQAGLLDPNGAPLTDASPAYTRLTSDVLGVSMETLDWLARHPQELHLVSPRRFEEIVAAIFERLGYSVTLTPATRDGGKDLYAARKTEVGTVLYIVECKKFAPQHPVGVEVVRELHGVLELERGTQGVIATTSYFSQAAKQYQRRIQYRMSLQDYIGIQSWLKQVTRADRDAPTKDSGTCAPKRH